MHCSCWLVMTQCIPELSSCCRDFTWGSNFPSCSWLLHSHTSSTHSGLTSTYLNIECWPLLPPCLIARFLSLRPLFIILRNMSLYLTCLSLSHINHPVPRPAIVSVHITKQRKHFDVVIGQFQVSPYTPECQISSLALPCSPAERMHAKR